VVELIGNVEEWDILARLDITVTDLAPDLSELRSFPPYIPTAFGDVVHKKGVRYVHTMRSFPHSSSSPLQVMGVFSYRPVLQAMRAFSTFKFQPVTKKASSSSLSWQAKCVCVMHTFI
jgi:hypothetical protein